MFLKILKATCNGIAQVTFVENWQYGLVVGGFITLMNPPLGISIFVGSFLSIIIALKLYDKEFVFTGIPAFNTVILFLTIFFVHGGLSNLFYVIPFTIVCMILYYWMNKLLEKYNLTALALPGVLTSYIVLFLGYLIPTMFVQTELTAFYQFSYTLGEGLLNHFLLNLSSIYLQHNVGFAMVLLLCYFCVRREYILYITISFIFAFIIFWLIQPLNLVAFDAFPTFNIFLGLMGATTLGVIKKDKYLILNIFLFTVAVIVVEIIFNMVFSFTSLKAFTLPFMAVVFLIQIYQNQFVKDK